MVAKLEPKFVEKPWGREELPPPFAPRPGERIGEIWFQPPAPLDSLLVKHLFTSEKLSVQVHPTDRQAEELGSGKRGKDECWLVLHAEPGAMIAIGFERQLDAEQVREACLDGTVESCLSWYEVAPGDFFYIPANTVHAIGAGVHLVEVQQSSDVTYRLYDYGRARELQLDHGLAVARTNTYSSSLHRKLDEEGSATLVDGPFFRLDRLIGSADVALGTRYAGHPLLAMPIKGSVTISGSRIDAGDCAIASELADIAFEPGGETLLAQPAGR